MQKYWECFVEMDGCFEAIATQANSKLNFMDLEQ
jgi:hypothetical protein